MFASQDGGFSPSALVHISATEPIARMALKSDPHFHVVSAVQHYDGAYYYAIARDPLIVGTAHKLIDLPAYRYGHPLHGWLAGLLSFGQPGGIPLALLLLSLIGLAVAGWAVSRLASHFGRSPWGGLLVAFSPGLLFAASVDTTETVGVALIALAFLAWARERYGLAVLVIALACLDREQYVTVPLGLMVWEALQWRRTSARPAQLRIKVLAVGVGPLLLAGWYIYVHARLHTWPNQLPEGTFGPPFVGWRNAFRISHLLANGDFNQSEIGSVSPAVLVATAAVITVAVIAARRIVTMIDATLIGMAIFTSMQGELTLAYPHEIFRTPAVAVLLAIAVLLTRPGKRATALPRNIAEG
jgi:hypothetical protein